MAKENWFFGGIYLDGSVSCHVMSVFEPPVLVYGEFNTSAIAPGQKQEKSKAKGSARCRRQMITEKNLVSSIILLFSRLARAESRWRPLWAPVPLLLPEEY